MKPWERDSLVKSTTSNKIKISGYNFIYRMNKKSKNDIISRKIDVKLQKGKMKYLSNIYFESYLD